MFQCKWCDKQYDNYISIGKHAGRTHKISREQLRIEYFHDGVPPVCQCGCGELVNFHQSGYGEYIRGHNSRVSNPILTLSNEQWTQRKARHRATNKAQFASGERVMWNKGLTKETSSIVQRLGKQTSENTERAAKISEWMTGRPKSEEHKKNSRIGITNAWKDPELRERQRGHAMERFRQKARNAPTKIEKIITAMLEDLSVEFTFQFRLQRKLFDFHVTGTMLLIEVDGDFWHCNPTSRYAIPKYPLQFRTIENDRAKDQLAIDQGYTLLRFWESDIHTRPEWVKAEVQSALAAIR